MAAAATAPLLTEPSGHAFDKVEPYRAPPTISEVRFDPEKHLCFEPPQSFISLKELLLSEENAISPVAITDPFPLFTVEGVKQMRSDLFRREVVEKYGDRTQPGCYKMRGYSKDTPFVDSVWRHEKVLQACSQAAGVDLAVVYDYEIGHINVQYDALDNDTAIWDALPPVLPPKHADSDSTVQAHGPSDELASVGPWHRDCYPWVCVCMLSDPSNMVGGETGLRRGDGTIAKVKGPGIGWAVMMQGGCIEHIALKAIGTGERISMVTSFRAKDPLAKDISKLGSVKRSSKLNVLFQQWSSYRLDVLAERVAIFRERLEAGDMSAEDITKAMAEWNEEQFAYMKYTATQMMGDGNPGSEY